MLFESIEEAANFYKVYTLKGGFGIRRHTTNYSRVTKELCARMFVCSKEGEYKKKKKNVEEGK